MASIELAQVVEEPVICEPEVSRTHGSTVRQSLGVWPHEEPIKGLEDLDPDDFLGSLGDEPEGVSDLVLRDDPNSLLMCLRMWRERVTMDGHHSMPRLSLCMELGLHDLLIFQLD